MKSNNISLVLIILVYKLMTVYGGDLPPEIQKCKSTDNSECIGKTIEQIFKLYPDGNPEFGMPSVAALNLTNLKVSRPNPTSPIQINFEFLKCTVNGLENIKILNTSGFDKELKKPELNIYVPYLRLKGLYEVSGKLLLLPLNGKGKGDIELKDVTAHVVGKLALEKRNGKNYAKIKTVKAVIEPKKLSVKLENVFNDNPVLSDTINSVINENWRDVWTELQDGINRTMEIFVMTVMREILNELSVDDFYVD